MLAIIQSGTKLIWGHAQSVRLCICFAFLCWAAGRRILRGTDLLSSKERRGRPATPTHPSEVLFPSLLSPLRKPRTQQMSHGENLGFSSFQCVLQLCSVAQLCRCHHSSAEVPFQGHFQSSACTQNWQMPPGGKQVATVQLTLEQFCSSGI